MKRIAPAVRGPRRRDRGGAPGTWSVDTAIRYESTTDPVALAQVAALIARVERRLS
jgi:hypothetical protein